MTTIHDEENNDLLRVGTHIRQLSKSTSRQIIDSIHDEEKIECPHGNWLGECNDCPESYGEYIYGKFSHIRQKTIDEVTTWLRNRCDANIQIHGTDKWNSDMEELLGLLTNTQ